MKNKPLFWAAALLLFVISGLAGYFGPPLVRDYRLEKRRESFLPPGVPVSVSAAFANQFSNLSASVEPQTLPDDTIVTITGEKTRISDFAGKPTLVNFWATWCPPCIVELPSLEK